MKFSSDAIRRMQLSVVSLTEGKKMLLLFLGSVKSKIHHSCKRISEAPIPVASAERGLTFLSSNVMK